MFKLIIGIIYIITIILYCAILECSPKLIFDFSSNNFLA